MIKQFSHEDLDKWGNFSGDRNKIHFDKSIAVQNGLKDIVVQGMLVLLDAKSMISAYITEQCSLNFYLKKPVFVDTDVMYGIKKTDKKYFLTVSELEQQEEACVTASLISQNRPSLEKIDHRIRIKPHTIQEQTATIKSLYPIITSNWLLIDTLLFSLSFFQQKDDYFHKKAKKLSKEHDENKIITYQVDHKIFISDQLIKYDSIDLSHFSFSFVEKEIFTSKDSAYSVLESQVYEDDTIIYQSSLGCFTKSYAL